MREVQPVLKQKVVVKKLTATTSLVTHGSANMTHEGEAHSTHI